jgi:beta-barrel assembly-enhancing protease
MNTRQSIYGIVLPLLILLVVQAFPRYAFGMTTEEEKKLGRKIFLEMEAKAAVVRDLSVQAFLDKMGRSLVGQIGATPYEFTFCPIQAPEPNAFALPGGYIFVTTGLLVLAESEQEIAGVLSHEIAHVVQRHVVQMIERSKAINLATLAAILVGALAGGGGPSSQATGALAMGLAGASMLKYTREMEADADQNSLRYVIKAGYDPKGLITFLTKIQKLTLSVMPSVPVYLLTHPETESRISLLENLMRLEPKRTGQFREIGSLRKVQAKAFVEERESAVAVSHFQSAVSAKPQDPDAYYGLGLAYRKMGRLDTSMETFQNGYAVSRNDADFLREMGISQFLAGLLDQSIQTLETVSEGPAQDQDDLLRLYYLARAYQEKGDFERALPLLRRLHKAMPDFPEGSFNLASVLGRMGEKGLSHFYFGKHFRLKGDAAAALIHFRTAVQLLERGNPERDEAQEQIRELGRPSDKAPFQN